MNLRTITCECGHQFTAKDINPPFTLPPIGFYGGVVKRFCLATCKCGKQYKLYISPKSHSWEVIDMESTDPTTDKEVDAPTTELACKYCGKICKGPVGLRSHEKACKNR